MFSPNVTICFIGGNCKWQAIPNSDYTIALYIAKRPWIKNYYSGKATRREQRFAVSVVLRPLGSFGGKASESEGSGGPRAWVSKERFKKAYPHGTGDRESLSSQQVFQGVNFHGFGAWLCRSNLAIMCYFMITPRKLVSGGSVQSVKLCPHRLP